MELVRSYFPDLDDGRIKKLAEFSACFGEWNSKLNLISRKDLDQLETRHILHSLSIAKFIRFSDNSNVMDLGCGGGFPGLPLAIYFPNIEFVLVDSIRKKIDAVNDMVHSLELQNVTVINDRAENVKRKFDFVVSRAVAPMNKLWAWCRNGIEKSENNALPNGLIALKGGDLKVELNPFGQRVVVQDLSRYFKEDFFDTKKIVYLRA